jgi:hypothetical protein
VEQILPGSGNEDCRGDGGGKIHTMYKNDKIKGEKNSITFAYNLQINHL